jgi:hypothetical protein
MVENFQARDGELRWWLLEKKRKETIVGDLFLKLQSLEIQPILIKGLASAMNYPPNVPRYFGDIDLAFSEEDFARILDLRISGLLDDVHADFHRELRHLDTAHWSDLVANSVTIDFHGTAVQILRPEDHLRVVCVHWLTDGGARKDRLWDIHYAIQNRAADFDWGRCLDIVSRKRRQWIILAISIAHHYLHLSIDDLPFRDEIQTPVPWIRRCLEAEWRSALPLTDIPSPRRKPTAFIKQIAKRIRPNPITATIECDGAFGLKIPRRYQFRVLTRYLMNALTLETNRKKREREFHS